MIQHQTSYVELYLYSHLCTHICIHLHIIHVTYIYRNLPLPNAPKDFHVPPPGLEEDELEEQPETEAAPGIAGDGGEWP